MNNFLINPAAESNTFRARIAAYVENTGIDLLVSQHTAFSSLWEMVCTTAPNYSPSLTPRQGKAKHIVKRNKEVAMVAYAFNYGCELTGQTRRAYQG